MSGATAVAFALRPLAAGDVARVAAIEAAAFAAPWSEAAFRHELDLPFSRSLVAHPVAAPEAVAGYVVWWRVADEIHLLDVAVAPEFRRRGVGALLTRAVLADADAAGARVTVLEVAEDNPGAHALYVALGFTTVQRRRDYYAPGRDALVMERASAAANSA